MVNHHGNIQMKWWVADLYHWNNFHQVKGRRQQLQLADHASIGVKKKNHLQTSLKNVTGQVTEILLNQLDQAVSAKLKADTPTRAAIT